MIRLDQIFHISYGTKLDKNKTIEVRDDPVLFVSRTSKNHGIDLICQRQIGIQTNQPNTISVPLGGEGRLSAFVQFSEYYNGQNVAILTPIKKFDLNLLIYYSLAIKSNQFRYSAFGREANSTLGSILLPEIHEIPSFVKQNITFNVSSKKGKHSVQNTGQNRLIPISDLFDRLEGQFISEEDADKCDFGDIAFVSSGRFNNGVKRKISLIGMEATVFPKGCLTLAKNGSVGECFFHESNIAVTSDVIVLRFKYKKINVYEGLFFATLIRQHIFRFNYGRKINDGRFLEMKMEVPFKNDKIDYDYINAYMKGFAFSEFIL